MQMLDIQPFKKKNVRNDIYYKKQIDGLNKQSDTEKLTFFSLLSINIIPPT